MDYRTIFQMKGPISPYELMRQESRLKEEPSVSAPDHAFRRKLTRFPFLFSRLFLGGIFIYASYDKILHPAAFAEVVYNYQILPDSLINVSSLILPWLELVLGLLLIIRFWLLGAVLVSNALLFIFFLTLLFNSARGLDIDCGCFALSTVVSSGGHMLWYIVRDSFFLLVGLYLFFITFFFFTRDRNP